MRLPEPAEISTRIGIDHLLKSRQIRWEMKNDPAGAQSVARLLHRPGRWMGKAGDQPNSKTRDRRPQNPNAIGQRNDNSTPE